MISGPPKMNNAHRTYIPLYCSQPTQTRDSDDSLELSDFPPIKIRKSTPPIPVCFRPPRPQAARGLGGSQELPVLVSSEEEPPRSQHRQPNTGLGRANILNMVGRIVPVPHAKVTSYLFTTAGSHANCECKFQGVRSHLGKSPLKRQRRQDSGIQDAASADEPPLKKQRLTSTLLEKDMRWVRNEIVDVRESLEKIAAEAREGRRDINSTLQELLREIRKP
jgi:hypothetical protein